MHNFKADHLLNFPGLIVLITASMYPVMRSAVYSINMLNCAESFAGPVIF
jgi:hypothetical protein